MGHQSHESMPAIDRETVDGQANASGVAPASWKSLDPSGDQVAAAREVRGRLPMVTGADLGRTMLALIAHLGLAPLFWSASPEGSMPTWTFVAIMFAVTLTGPVAWREKVRPRSLWWPPLAAAVLTMLVVGMLDPSSWWPTAGDRFFRTVGAGLFVSALAAIAQRLWERRTLPRSGSVPTPVLPSAPALAVLLALDQVSLARTGRVAEVLGMPEEMARSWLVHLCSLGLAQGSLGDRYNISPAGRRLLDDHLGMPSAGH